jgi:hypothetical protein
MCVAEMRAQRTCATKRDRIRKFHCNKHASQDEHDDDNENLT